jgi:hypothetical protein
LARHLAWLARRPARAGCGIGLLGVVGDQTGVQQRRSWRWQLAGQIRAWGCLRRHCGAAQAPRRVEEGPIRQVVNGAMHDPSGQARRRQRPLRAHSLRCCCWPLPACRVPFSFSSFFQGTAVEHSADRCTSRLHVLPEPTPRASTQPHPTSTRLTTSNPGCDARTRFRVTRAAASFISRSWVPSPLGR